jgi:hypothetical protein
MCLTAAMSDAAAMACDTAASSAATMLLGAVDDCGFTYCTTAQGGAAARCKVSATDGSPQNPDGTAAFDPNTGMPSGDCGTCLDNTEAVLFGDTCTGDGACTACTTQINACKAN